MKTYEQTNRFAESVANHQGWALNYDRQFVKTLINGLAENYNRYGYYLCPCREGWAEREKDKDIICPCIYADPDIKQYGHCFCGLYLSREHCKNRKEVQSIPERRKEELFP